MSDRRRAARAVAFKAFHDVLETRRDEVDQAVMEVAAQMPGFGEIIASMPAEQLAAQRERSRRLQRAALLEDEWDEYVVDLATQGETYAQLGVSFREWFGLLGAYRNTILEGLIPAEGSARDVLEGMDAFVDHAMGVVGEAYVEMKARQVRRAEERLSLYVDVVDRAQVGILVYHWDTPPDLGSLRLVVQNAAAARLGASSAHVDRTLAETNPAVLESEVAAHYLATLQTGEPRSWAIDWARVDGQIVPYEAHCYRLENRHLAVFFEDVTQKRRAADALAAHARELERSNRDLDDFAYVASHDLKSPLRDIHNLATWIAEDLSGELPQSTARHVRMLTDRVTRMEALLDDLLQYSRAGRGAIERGEVSLQQALASVVALVGAGAYTIEGRGLEEMIPAPRTPVELVLRNLLSNAIKHHDRPAGLIVVSVEREGGFTCVEVSDDGPGIPSEHSERVFKLFQTLGRREDQQGSGMGLAVVKKVVEAHGGRVELRSQGRGTKVRTYWPHLEEVAK